jgi:glycerophosphoryl diester phosphodiesterase
LPLVWFGLSLALLLVLWGVSWRPRTLPGIPPKPTLLLGHRGVRGSLPENTLPAFRAALDASLDGLETDLQRSADAQIVLYHDFTLPDGRALENLTLNALREANSDMPTLEELFALAEAYPRTLLNLELKTVTFGTRGLERETAAAIRRSRLTDRILVSSFNPSALVRLRLHAPEIRTALLYSADGPRWLRSNRSARLLARLLHVDALHPHFTLIDEDLALWARRQGVMLNAWTVNDPLDVKRLTRLNVNGLMADDPEALKDAFKEAMWSPISP